MDSDRRVCGSQLGTCINSGVHCVSSALPLVKCLHLSRGHGAVWNFGAWCPPMWSGWTVLHLREWLCAQCLCLWWRLRRDRPERLPDLSPMSHHGQPPGANGDTWGKAGLAS